MGINIGMREIRRKCGQWAGTEHRLFPRCVIGLIAGRLLDFHQADRSILMKPKRDDSRRGTIRKIQCRGFPDIPDSLLHERQIGLSRRCPIGHSLLSRLYWCLFGSDLWKEKSLTPIKSSFEYYLMRARGEAKSEIDYRQLEEPACRVVFCSHKEASLAI